MKDEEKEKVVRVILDIMYLRARRRKPQPQPPRCRSKTRRGRGYVITAAEDSSVVSYEDKLAVALERTQTRPIPIRSLPRTVQTALELMISPTDWAAPPPPSPHPAFPTISGIYHSPIFEQPKHNNNGPYLKVGGYDRYPRPGAGKLGGGFDAIGESYNHCGHDYYNEAPILPRRIPGIP